MITCREKRVNVDTDGVTRCCKRTSSIRRKPLIDSLHRSNRCVPNARLYALNVVDKLVGSIGTKAYALEVFIPNVDGFNGLRMLLVTIANGLDFRVNLRRVIHLHPHGNFDAGFGRCFDHIYTSKPRVERTSAGKVLLDLNHVLGYYIHVDTVVVPGRVADTCGKNFSMDNADGHGHASHEECIYSHN